MPKHPERSRNFQRWPEQQILFRNKKLFWNETFELRIGSGRGGLAATSRGHMGCFSCVGRAGLAGTSRVHMCCGGLAATSRGHMCCFSPVGRGGLAGTSCGHICQFFWVCRGVGGDKPWAHVLLLAGGSRRVGGSVCVSTCVGVQVCKCPSV